MSFVRRLDIRKLWAPSVVAAMVLASVGMTFLLFRAATIAFLPFRDTSSAVSATPPAEAERTPADQALREPSALHQNADDPAHQISASETAPPETTSAPHPGAPRPEGSPPAAGGQRILKSRKALETVDPREFLRQANMPK